MKDKLAKVREAVKVTYAWVDYDPENKIACLVCDAIAALDEIEADDGWCYDMDAAPKSNGHVCFLLYINGHGPVVACRMEDGTFFNYSRRKSLLDSGRLENTKALVAWRPLPQPPKGKADEPL